HPYNAVAEFQRAKADAVGVDGPGWVGCALLQAVLIGQRPADIKTGSCRIHNQLGLALRKIGFQAVAVDMLHVGKGRLQRKRCRGHSGQNLQVCEFSESSGNVACIVASAFFLDSASISFIVASALAVPSMSFAGDTMVSRACWMSGSVGLMS